MLHTRQEVQEADAGAGRGASTVTPKLEPADADMPYDTVDETAVSLPPCASEEDEDTAVRDAFGTDDEPTPTAMTSEISASSAARASVEEPPRPQNKEIEFARGFLARAYKNFATANAFHEDDVSVTDLQSNGGADF